MNDYVKTLRQSIGSSLIHLPGVRALIFNDREEILLQLRTDMAFWSLPAGAVEIGESALEALQREVAEETSLQVITRSAAFFHCLHCPQVARSASCRWCGRVRGAVLSPYPTAG
jgi:8-oxo-dGTP pyrophosphatase MutT (NUDIX family)